MKLSRLTIPYRALRNSASIAFVIIFTGSFSITEINLVSLGIVAASAGLIILINLFWAYLVWKNYSYSFKGDSIKIKHGVLRKKDRKIPLKRIQNVDVNRNIFQRALGIAQVSLETAGGDTTEASFKYLALQDARSMRDKIRERKSERSEDEQESTEAEEEEPIYEINDRELLVLSFTSIDARVVAAIFAVFGVAPAIIGGYLEEADIGLTMGMGLILVGITGATWISSAVTTFLQYWDFRLYRKDDSLEYERGLLNRSEGSIPLEKIQKVTMEENLLKRIFGYATLKIDTAGYSPSQSMQQGPEAAIPLAKKAKTLKIAENIQGIKDTDWQNISKRARIRYTSRYMLASILGTSVLFFTSMSPVQIAGIVIVLFTVSVTGAHLKWKNKGFNAGKEHVVTVNGFWNRSTNYIPYFRVQNLIETRTVLQRKWRLSTVDIDTAGTGNIMNRTVAVDLDSEEAGKFKQEVFEKFQKSLRDKQENSL
jgi:putative membrane protein